MPDTARSAPRTLICGSLALDTIMVFPDRFARHILPGETHVLSVSFQIAEMRREWGGCAGNIAYNLKGLGGEPVVMATVGDDGGSYLERLAAQNVAADGVRMVPGTYTAQAFIITDLDDNQITAFHPGAMNESHRNCVGDVADIALGIVAPDGREGMRSHVREFAAARVPFIFDPGQGLPLFSGAELIEMIDCAEYVAVNDYEARLLAERTGLSIDAIAARVEALIVTRGGEGSCIYADGAALEIPAVTPSALVDPTGCGDAYRAGLLYGIGQGWDWERTGRLASLLGSIKIASRGGQNHSLGRDTVAAQYHERFGQPLF
ncbi:MAG TPA: carbohydrate kinase family protein [Casimicrobiaceae bacterium]|nr:carbohydrate kinase family protein [Casimicrobiaceae bacterium]